MCIRFKKRKWPVRIMAGGVLFIITLIYTDNSCEKVAIFITCCTPK